MAGAGFPEFLRPSASCAVATILRDVMLHVDDGVGLAVIGANGASKTTLTRVLMLDEPSLGLAPKRLDDLYGLLAELRNQGTTILLVDQMAALALSVAARACVLQGGTVKHSGNGAHDLRYDLSM